MLLFNELSTYGILFVIDFNTSNVTIQLVCLVTRLREFIDFNTSNVTIQQLLQARCR